MKRTGIALSAILLFAAIIASPVSAHVLKTDGTIGVVLHIQPDDNPTTGVDTTYQLSFADTTSRFILSGCDCSVSVQLEGKTIKTNPLVVSGPLVSTNIYDFKAAGVYTLVVDGKPKPGYSFDHFSINYVVRAMPNNQIRTQPFPLTLGIGLGLMVVLLLLVAVKADGMLDDRNTGGGNT